MLVILTFLIFNLASALSNTLEAQLRTALGESGYTVLDGSTVPVTQVSLSDSHLPGQRVCLPQLVDQFHHLLCTWPRVSLQLFAARLPLLQKRDYALLSA